MTLLKCCSRDTLPEKDAWWQNTAFLVPACILEFEVNVCLNTLPGNPDIHSPNLARRTGHVYDCLEAPLAPFVGMAAPGCAFGKDSLVGILAGSGNGCTNGAAGSKSAAEPDCKAFCANQLHLDFLTPGKS